METSRISFSLQHKNKIPYDAFPIKTIKPTTRLSKKQAIFADAGMSITDPTLLFFKTKPIST